MKTSSKLQIGSLFVAVTPRAGIPIWDSKDSRFACDRLLPGTLVVLLEVDIDDISRVKILTCKSTTGWITSSFLAPVRNCT